MVKVGVRIYTLQCFHMSGPLTTVTAGIRRPSLAFAQRSRRSLLLGLRLAVQSIHADADADIRARGPLSRDQPGPSWNGDLLGENRLE